MRKLWTAILAVLLFMGIASVAPPASAEIVEGVTTYWGVSGLMTGTINDDLDSEVWAIEQIGDRVYVGGRFTDVTHEGVLYPRPAIAAFDAQSGIWIDTFTPDLNGGAVYALQASSDGSRLFVGGDFSQYETTNVKGLVALDPLTGAADWSFEPRVSGGFQPAVRALDIEGDWLYVAGSFDALKADGVGLDIDSVGRVSQTTGVVDQSFTPVVMGGSVWGIDASPTSTNVYLAGTFDSVNGQVNTEAFAAVDDAGATVPTGFQPNNTNRNYMQDVESVNGLVFVGGSEHVLSVYNESDWSLVISHFTNNDARAFSSYPDVNYGGSRFVSGAGESNNIASSTSSIKVADGFTATLCTGDNQSGTCTVFNGFHPTLPAGLDDNVGSVLVVRDEVGPDDGRGGDYQDIEVVGDRVYASCHCWGDHWTNNTIYDWVARDTPEGTWQDAQWIHAYSATTGDFIDTFKSGATNSGTGPWAIHGADNGCLWFGGGVTGSGGQPADGFTRLCDSAYDSEPPAAPTGFTAVGDGPDSVDVEWVAAVDNVGTVSYQIYNNDTGELVTTSPTTNATITGLTPFTDYSFYVKGTDAEGNQGSRSNVIVVNIGGIEPPVSCTSINSGTAANITWDEVVGAADYRVTRAVDGGTYYWRGVTALTSFDDTLRSSGIHSYQVQARLTGGQWSTPVTCQPDLDPVDGLTGASPVPVCTATNDGTAATIDWDAAENANDYRIKRSVDGSAFYWRGSTTDLTFADTLRTSGIHTFSVEARGDDGIWSAATTCSPPVENVPTPVLAPATCTASSVGVDATIAWDASVDAADYRIRRSIDGGTTYWRAVTVDTTTTDTLRTSGIHVYYVAARALDGAWSDETTCAPALDPTDGLPGASAPATCTVTAIDLAATITWDAAENGIDYRVYRSVNDGPFYWRGLTTDLTLSDTLRANSTHVYEVQARGADGVWSASTTCSVA